MVLTNILILLAFLPLAGVAIIFLTQGPEDKKNNYARWTAFWTSMVVFILSTTLWVHFDLTNPDFQFVSKLSWISDSTLSLHFGIDGISILFILLTTFLIPICILASWQSIQHHVKLYMIAFLILETMLIGMFCALDLVLFYVFFEGVLIPMFLIVGIWGGSRRVYASFKFFLYTLLGSILMLLAILFMYHEAHTTNIRELLTYHFTPEVQLWLWLAFFASFAVKIPMWPVHTWLPDAHVEAPTAGSVILAGVLLKMGGYGFLRFSLPMMPYASEFFAPLIFVLSIIAVIYTSLVALVQQDIKKLIAYSSIAHMGYVTAGIFTLNQQGMLGAITQMLSHGIVSAALFLCVGVIYDRLHTREISAYGGLSKIMPKYAVVFMIMTMASVGLPGTSGFVGEFLVMLGSFQRNTWVAAFITVGIILGAAYMLFLYARIFFGDVHNKKLFDLSDLNWREKIIFVPLIIIVMWMGIYPSSFTKLINPALNQLIENYHHALDQEN
ncbi:MAG: NADH-quinone oxidoreductase subunit M [Alphaproteobacteria bacterium]|nr:NADH-quinone oxidoreductase subunit M [Alphaproteobacteria bacterium]